MIKRILCFSFMVLMMCNANAKTKLNGIIIPTALESHYLLSKISDQKIKTISGVKYITGKINHKDVVFINSGMGKINAAAITARMIRDFHPDLILLAGSLGSINPKLKLGDVVIGKDVIDADFGELTPQGIQFRAKSIFHDPVTNTQLPLHFELNKKLLNFFEKLVHNVQQPKIILGKIATSDALPNPPAQIKLLRENNVDVVAMEGVALMQTCWMFKTSCVVIRGVSNEAGKAITKEDVEKSADNAAKVVIDILKWQ